MPTQHGARLDDVEGLFQVRSLEAGKTKSARSRQVIAFRFVCRLSTTIFWRSRAFSSTNSVMLRARSTAVLRVGASLSGFLSTDEGVVRGPG